MPTDPPELARPTLRDRDDARACEAPVCSLRDGGHVPHDSEGNLLGVLGEYDVLTDDLRSNVFRATAAVYRARIRRVRAELGDDRVLSVALELFEWR